MESVIKLFKGHWRMLALIILVVSTSTVTISKYYFESDNHSCSQCLDENEALLNRLVRISALAREFSKSQQTLSIEKDKGIFDDDVYEDYATEMDSTITKLQEPMNTKIIKEIQILSDID